MDTTTTTSTRTLPTLGLPYHRAAVSDIRKTFACMKHEQAGKSSDTCHVALKPAQPMGMTYLNPNERQLIDMLRFTTYQGRRAVMELAKQMRQSRPWVDGSPNNTL